MDKLFGKIVYSSHVVENEDKSISVTLKGGTNDSSKNS